MQHIGIFRLSALGDLTLCSAIVPLLRQAHPEAEITWITSTVGGLLLEGLPDVRLEVIGKPRGVRDLLALRRRFAGLRFDALLCARRACGPT